MGILRTAIFQDLYIYVYIYISYLTSDIHHAIHHENGIDATRFRKCELMCLGGRVSSSLFSLSCVYVKLILTYWRVIRNSITFTMLLYFFFFFVRTPESTDCQNFSISLKIFNLTTSTTFFDRRYYNYRQNWSPKSLNPNFAKRNQTIIRATLKSEFSELNFHAYL